MSLGTKIPKIDSFQKRVIEQPSNVSLLLQDITTDGTGWKQQFMVPCYIVSPLFMGENLLFQ